MSRSPTIKLSCLTEQELAELGEAILRELAERAESLSAGTESVEADGETQSNHQRTREGFLGVPGSPLYHDLTT